MVVVVVVVVLIIILILAIMSLVILLIRIALSVKGAPITLICLETGSGSVSSIRGEGQRYDTNS